LSIAPWVQAEIHPLSLNYPYGYCLDYLAGDTSLVGDVYHLGYILVGCGGFLGYGAHAACLNRNPPGRQRPDHIRPPDAALGCGAALHPAGSVTGGAEGLFHCRFCAHRDVGAASHIPGDENRLAYIAVNIGDIRMSGREGSGGSLAVNTERLLFAGNSVFLYLGDIMADIINLLQPYFPLAFTENPGEALSCPVGDALSVGPGVVGSWRSGRLMPYLLTAVPSTLM